MDSSLKQTTFSEVQTRHLKLGKLPIYCYKYLQCWLCNELLFPLEIFRLAKDEKKKLHANEQKY